jgi:hypothetical protein
MTKASQCQIPFFLETTMAKIRLVLEAASFSTGSKGTVMQKPGNNAKAFGLSQVVHKSKEIKGQPLVFTLSTHMHNIRHKAWVLMARH